MLGSGCGGGGEGGTGGAESRRGGTLRVAGGGGVDHLDTASVYRAPSYALARAFTRQLVTYPADPDPRRADDPVADAATELPTTANRRVSDDRRTYRFTVRDGVQWDTDPPRQVSSHDFVRGLERLCNPVAPVRAPGYYTSTIAGFDEYCAGLAKVEPSADAIRAYLEANDIPGITTPDDRTIELTLVRPTSDFLNIMALPSTSAAPEEYLDHLPDSAEFRRNTISNGPYSIVTYEADERIELARNPAWDAATDPVREALVDRIELEFGSTAESVQQRLETGTADLAWDTPVPATRIPALRGDDRLGLYDSGTTSPYLVINLLGGNNRGALRKLAVRQALNYAVDKVAIGQAYGGPAINTPLGQVLPPAVDGHRPFDPYPTPGHRGDPASARRLLGGAGHPDDLTLKLIHRTEGNQPRVAQAVRESLARAGVTVRLIPVSPVDFHDRYLGLPDAARRGAWDIATSGRAPDWAGNAARTLLVPMFYGREYGPGSTNSGGYVDPGTDACIERALAAADAAAAAPIWHECDRLVMADAPFVPLLSQKLATFHAARVRNFVYSPFTAAGDITHVWLADA
jgi:peptide/nickel transport system substrate-binding protein